MKGTTQKILDQTMLNYPMLESCRQQIMQAFFLLRQGFAQGGKVLVCGNGGSAADSEHIVGELMKGFLLKREIPRAIIDKFKKVFPDEWEYFSSSLQGALPAISLVSQTAIATAFINDIAPDMVFAQQVYGYAGKDDVLIGISTSGNSKNVVNAIKTAKALGIGSIGLTGQTGGAMNRYCDIVIAVPAAETFRIQELHLPVYHALCAMVESEIFNP